MIKTVLNDYSKKVEEVFNVYLPDINSNYKNLTDAMRYSFLLGGKRIRPALLMEFYKITGKTDENAINFAVALEMIHTYSLIHDDLPCMDDDDMRRGKPSNHKVFGEDIALLAGDGLLTHAFGVAADTKGISAENVLNALKELSCLSGYKGMVGGQVIDLESEGKAVSGEIINELNLLKTAGLLRAAAKIGVILADGDDKQIKAADEYGINVGICFQIVDDILDFTSDTATLGKPTGSDLKNDKSTYLSLYGMDKCKDMVNELTEKALLCLDKFDGDTTFLRELTLYLAERKS